MRAVWLQPTIVGALAVAVAVVVLSTPLHESHSELLFASTAAAAAGLACLRSVTTLDLAALCLVFAANLVVYALAVGPARQTGAASLLLATLVAVTAAVIYRRTIKRPRRREFLRRGR